MRCYGCACAPKNFGSQIAYGGRKLTASQLSLNIHSRHRPLLCANRECCSLQEVASKLTSARLTWVKRTNCSLLATLMLHLNLNTLHPLALALIISSRSHTRIQCLCTVSWEVGLQLEPFATIASTQLLWFLFRGPLLLGARMNKDRKSSIICFIVTNNGLTLQPMVLLDFGSGVKMSHWCIVGDRLILRDGPSNDLLIYDFGWAIIELFLNNSTYSSIKTRRHSNFKTHHYYNKMASFQTK